MQSGVLYLGKILSKLQDQESLGDCEILLRYKENTLQKPVLLTIAWSALQKIAV